MPGFAVFNETDIDGRHWKFAQQQKGMSCGPTSVKIAKELFHNKSVGEEAIRGSVGLQHLGLQNSGLGLVAAAANTDAIWQQYGTMERMVFPATKIQPLPIPFARFTHGIAGLQSASRNHPAILGFNWQGLGGGGHFVVCVGPTKTDPTLFVILDPDGGLQYLSSEDAVGTALMYNPSYGQRGKIDPIGYIVT